MRLRQPAEVTPESPDADIGDCLVRQLVEALPTRYVHWIIQNVSPSTALLHR